MAMQTSTCSSKHYLYYRSVLDLQDIESFEFIFITNFFQVVNSTSFVPKNTQSRYLELYLKDFNTTHDRAKTEVMESLIQKEEERASANSFGSYRLIRRVKQFLLNLFYYKSLEVAKEILQFDDQFLLRQCGLVERGRFRSPINNVYLEESLQLDIAPAKTEPTVPYNNKVKYSVISPIGLQARIQLEWKLYPSIKQLYFKYRNRTKDAFREGFETQHQDVRTYLQDFEDSTKNFVKSLENWPADTQPLHNMTSFFNGHI
ncbi:unnamed protein product [Allacma fusca]|uniref:Uncharacterized protein n=1 Tax=Allacma fusca TaxID=39272 RepID=A0A8J2PSM5_9HEXA|nr:unnamed protein product [Allacma fusca]